MRDNFTKESSEQSQSENEPEGERGKGKEAEEEPPLPRALGAEALGTFILTFVDAGSGIIAGVRHEGDYTARALVPGLTVAAMIYALGNVSGAHINPAATLAFAARGVFSWRKVPLYIVAQIFGAIAAAFWLRTLFGPVHHLGANEPHAPLITAFGMEATLTCILATVILATATRHQNLGPEAALAVGATVALCNLFAKPITGASMNPARSLGPALVSGEFSGLWIYLAAPLVGALLAVALTRLIHGRAKAEELEAARGEGEKS